MAKRFLDRDDPFFAPTWRRWAVIAVCFGWACVEIANGAVAWSMIFIVAGVYALWELVLRPPAGGPKE